MHRIKSKREKNPIEAEINICCNTRGKIPKIQMLILKAKPSPLGKLGQQNLFYAPITVALCQSKPNVINTFVLNITKDFRSFFFKLMVSK